jgi:hypothetical protein
MFKRIAIAAGTAAVAAAVGGSALAVASTGSAQHRAAGTEHFQLMSTSTTSPNSALLAYGAAFTAAGTDHAGKGNTDTVQFANGTFKLVHKMTGGTQHINPATCQFTVTATATYKLSGGTGAYKGISGSGSAKVSVLGIGARNSKGKCSKTMPPVAQQQLIQASGPASLP